MTIHTVRLDIITAIEQHRRDTITIRSMAIAIDLTIDIRIMAIAISHIVHLRRSVIMEYLIMGHLIMNHPINIAHLLTESIDKKYNEI